jgi:predicted nucleic acid-binding protein
MARHGEPLPFTPWHRLEVRNAIRLAAFHRSIEGRQSKTQLKQMETDLQEETLIVHTPIDWTEVLRETEKLGAAHNETIGCRSGDLFHVASACHAGANRFLTFDERQKKMARIAGLNVQF